MSDQRTISPADALAISLVSADFGYLVDHGRATECAGLFTADAKLIFGPGSPKPGTLDGIEAIRAFLVARQAQTHVTTRHIATNFRMHQSAPDVTEVESLLQVFRSDDESRLPVIGSVSEVLETYSRSHSGQWLIQQRTTTPIFVK